MARLPRGAFAIFGMDIDRDSPALTAIVRKMLPTGKSLADPNTLRYCDMFGSSSLTYNGINIGSLGSPSPPWAQAFTAQGSIPIHWGFVGSLSFYQQQLSGWVHRKRRDREAKQRISGPRTISDSSTAGSWRSFTATHCPAWHADGWLPHRSGLQSRVPN